MRMNEHYLPTSGPTKHAVRESRFVFAEMLMGIAARYTRGMTVQIALKLPDRLAAELDELVKRGEFKSRSQAVREGLETILAARERERLRARYRQALETHPESAAEIGDATRLAIESIEDEPWERWW